MSLLDWDSGHAPPFGRPAAPSTRVSFLSGSRRTASRWMGRVRIEPDAELFIRVPLCVPPRNAYGRTVDGVEWRSSVPEEDRGWIVSWLIVDVGDLEQRDVWAAESIRSHLESAEAEFRLQTP